VFNDVPEVRAFMEAPDEAAWFPRRTVVIVNAWQQRQKALVEAVNRTAFNRVQIFEIEFHRQHGSMAEDIGTCKCPDAVDVHGARCKVRQSIG
jgi:hypothetical protein